MKRMKKICQPNTLTCESHICTNWTLCLENTQNTLLKKKLNMTNGQIKKFNFSQIDPWDFDP